MIIDLDGTLDGTGVLDGTPVGTVIANGLLGGSSDLAALALLRTILEGGQAFGVGDVRYSGTDPFGETLSGSGEVVGELGYIFSLRGVFRGVGNLRDSVPLPLSGFGNLLSYVEVQPAPHPICTPDTRPRFSFMQMLQRGDLSVCLCDSIGNPYSPTSITYAFYEILEGGYRQLRGPAKRTPAKAGIGCYYATGYVGECGQPGNWVIVWSWSHEGTCHTSEEGLVVQAGPPVPGCPKYGWD